MKIALLGNPNAGKTGVFNALTGEASPTGNWAGVTVDRCEKQFKINQTHYKLTDLPGCYALHCPLGSTSLDQQLTHEYLINNQVDVMINVVDACTLARHLYLTYQLIELQIPMVLVVTKLDLLENRGSPLI